MMMKKTMNEEAKNSLTLTRFDKITLTLCIDAMTLI